MRCVFHFAFFTAFVYAQGMDFLSPPPNHRKILFADDDPDFSKILCSTLQQSGYNLVTVADGQAAVDAFKKERPELVILDVDMPIKNGIQACEEIRELDDRVLILILTGRAKTQIHKADGLVKGADDYLTKPFGPRELIARIRSLYRRLDL